MAYHIHKALKYRRLGEVIKIDEERKNNPLVNKADLISLHERLDVSKESLSKKLNVMANYGYLTKKKYISSRNGCRYYYVINDLGIRVFQKLHEKMKKGESLDLRHPTKEKVGPYIRTSEKYIEKRIKSLENKKRDIDEQIEKLNKEKELLNSQDRPYL